VLLAEANDPVAVRPRAPAAVQVMPHWIRRGLETYIGHEGGSGCALARPFGPGVPVGAGQR